MKAENFLKDYLEKNSIYDIKILREDDYLLFCPLTEEAVKWCFQDTLWNWETFFTSKFRHSHEIYPILICVIEHEKLLLQVDSKHKRVTFIHSNYQHVNIEYIETHWEKLKSLVLWLENINFIPEKYLTKEICVSLLEKNGDVFKKIPDSMKDEELCIKAIEVDSKNLEYIPNSLRSFNFYKALVKKDGLLLKIVPKFFIDFNICELAVRQNGHALKYVPDFMRIESLCQISLNDDLANIVFVPEKYLTEEIYIKSLKKHPTILSIVPKEYLTKEICEYAVIKNPMIIHSVPEEWREEINMMIKRYMNGPLRLYSYNFIQTFDEIERFFMKKGK